MLLSVSLFLLMLFTFSTIITLLFLWLMLKLRSVKLVILVLMLLCDHVECVRSFLSLLLLHLLNTCPIQRCLSEWTSLLLQIVLIFFYTIALNEARVDSNLTWMYVELLLVVSYSWTHTFNISKWIVVDIVKSINLEFAKAGVESLHEFFKHIAAVTHQFLCLFFRECAGEVSLWHFKVRKEQNEYFLGITRNLYKVNLVVYIVKVPVKYLPLLIDAKFIVTYV